MKKILTITIREDNGAGSVKEATRIISFTELDAMAPTHRQSFVGKAFAGVEEVINKLKG